MERKKYEKPRIKVILYDGRACDTYGDDFRLL
jgi:hypothetical protein